LSDTRKKLIILIEDDAGDQKLIKRSISNFDSNIKTNAFSDGEEAINFFENLKNDSSFQLNPDLILLDLNLPKINGFEVLKYLKQDVDFRKTPVVALTTSNAETDVNKCYDNYVSGYFRKPTTIKELDAKIDRILNYWLKGCILPTKGGASLFKTSIE